MPPGQTRETLRTPPSTGSGSAVRPVDFAAGTDVVIRVENLWKEYRLGTINHGTLARDLSSWWARLRGKEDPNLKIDAAAQRHGTALAGAPDRFWALSDISFDVQRGDILGVIGRNGAGKSTLLKILSQVTAPTRGQVCLKGRVASLLEVGTGFHPDLTGRENVFLNGAILGMSKAEIRGKFDEIVAFAEIDKFIDTPVKRYSSGMYVRLAFAVAAHLEPEILVVDEVLAVGDASFQKKCLGKMEEVGRDGRTVLFVSHNMSAVSKLCGNGLLLKQGALATQGRIREVIGEYLSDSTVVNATFCREPDPGVPISFLSASVIPEPGVSADAIPRGAEAFLEIEYVITRSVSSCHIYAKIFDSEEHLLFGTGDADLSPDRYAQRQAGTYRCRFPLPTGIMNEGRYTISLSCGVPYKEVYQHEDHALGFTVVNLSGNQYLHNSRTGSLFLDIPWSYLSREPVSPAST